MVTIDDRQLFLVSRTFFINYGIGYDASETEGRGAKQIKQRGVGRRVVYREKKLPFVIRNEGSFCLYQNEIRGF